MNSLKLVMPSSISSSIAFERAVFHVSEDLVEAVVDRALARGLLVPGGNGIHRMLAWDCTMKSMIVVVPPLAAARYRSRT